MFRLKFSQYARPLVETMHISRGGFKSRTHNIICLHYKGHDYYSEVIGDAKLINYLFGQLTTVIKENNEVRDLQDLFHTVDKWINSFVYLEVHSSIHSIGCAFDWLRIITNSHISGMSIFEVLNIPTPTRKHTLVYGSNLYWKDSPEDFRDQIQQFDYKKTAILKIHLGRKSPEEEESLYKVIESESRIRHYMIDYNCGYNLNQLKDVSSLISSSSILREKLLWLEEPTHPDLAEQWCNVTSHPIAAGENHHGLNQLGSLCRAGLNWIMPDFGRTLFLSDLPKLLKDKPKDACISFHSYSSGFLAYISLLISTSLPIKETYYEHDFSENALLEDIVQDAIEIKDGIAYINEDAIHQLNLDLIDSSWSQSSTSIEL